MIISVPKFHQSSRIPTMKLYPKHNIRQRKLIVNLHNQLRSSVKPSASDMLRMVSIHENVNISMKYFQCFRLGILKRPKWPKVMQTSVMDSSTILRLEDGPGGLDPVARTSSLPLTRSRGSLPSSLGSQRRICSAMDVVGTI